MIPTKIEPKMKRVERCYDIKNLFKESKFVHDKKTNRTYASQSTKDLCDKVEALRAKQMLTQKVTTYKGGQ